jgi:uncharacterized protein YbaP (TraB family)
MGGAVLRVWRAVALASALACAPAQAVEPIKPAMWEAHDGNSRMWFVCSFDVLKSDTIWRTPVLEDALAQADVFYFKTLSTLPEAERAPDIVASHGELPEGLSLAGILLPDEWSALVAAAEASGLDPEMLNPMSPWRAALTLEDAVHFDGIVAGVDAILKAEIDDSKERALEPAEAEPRLLAMLSPPTQLAILNDAVSDASRPERTGALIDAWVVGDLDTIEIDQSKSRRFQFDDYTRHMLIVRNRAWGNGLMRVMQGDQDVMVVVDVEHLTGDFGLLAQMRRHGIYFTRVQ